MSLLSIALRNLRYRKLASFLTALSMALGVALVVLVLTVSGVIEKSLERTSNVGYNLIVGAKGSPLQLVFNTVFFLSQPVENVPYSYYMEYLPGDGRQKEYARLGGELKEPQRSGLYSFLITLGSFDASPRRRITLVCSSMGTATIRSTALSGAGIFRITQRSTGISRPLLVRRSQRRWV